MGGDNTSYQMLWDCEYCGSAKLLGLDHKHCPTCGGAQNPDSRYYPDEGEEIAVADHQFVGADKVCAACQAPNGTLAEFCVSCGSPLDASAEAKRRAERVEGEGDGLTGDSALAGRHEHRDRKHAGEQAERQAATGEDKKSSGGGGFLKIIVILVVVVGLLLLVLQLLKKDVALEVTAHSWQRSIDIEEFKTVTDQAWRDGLPAGARQGTCRQKERETKKVKDGQDCVSTQIDQGDGTFKKGEKCTDRFKEVAVMGQWCSYELERWTKLGSEIAKGKSTEGVDWPKVELRRKGDCIGCQREGNPTETYTLRLRDSEGGKTYTADCPEDRWKSTTLGQRFSATAMRGASSVSCDSLKAPE